MKYIFVFFGMLISFLSFSQPLRRGLGLRYADSLQLTSVKYVLPYKSTRGRLPSNVDLGADFPPINNQGAIGSCASWACVYALRSFVEKKKNGYSYLLPDGALDTKTVFSPLFIFNQVKDLGHRCDSVGSLIENNLKRMRDVGACKLISFNPSPYVYPCCTAIPLLNSQETIEASNYKIDDYAWIIRYGAYYGPQQKLAKIKEVLNLGYPIVIGVDIDSSFYKEGGQFDGQQFVWKTVNNYVGAHAMVCVGYNDTVGAIRVFNSWGTDWGNQGYGYISYQVLEDQLYEAWVMNPRDDLIAIQGAAMTGYGNIAEHTIDANLNTAPDFSKKDYNFFIKNRFQPYNNIRIMPVEINPKERQVVLKVYEVKNEKPYEIDVFVVRTNETYDFVNGGNVYHFKLEDIKRYNGIFSKYAAFYTLTINRK